MPTSRLASARYVSPEHPLTNPITMRLSRLAFALPLLLSALTPTGDGLVRYTELLVSVRSGEDSDLAEFTRLADSLARELDREDIRAVAEYYAALDAEERVQGLRDYRAFAEIWQHVLTLEEEGIRGAEWREERRALLVELRELAEQVEGRADYVPAARALSLAALIETEILVLAAPGRTGVNARFEQARLDAQQATALFKRAGQLRPQLEPLCTLARLERVQREHSASNDLYGECFRLAREVADKTYQEKALQGLVSLARRDGNLLEVDNLLRELAALKPPFENWPLTWRQAERLIDADQPARALHFLDRNPPRATTDQRAWHILRANAYTRLGDWDAARKETQASGSDPLRLARIHIGQGQHELALRQLEGVVSPTLDPRRELLLHMTRGEALLGLNRIEEALEEIQTARELSSHLETRLALEEGEVEGRSNINGEVMGNYGTLLYAEALARGGRVLAAAQAIESSQARRLRSDSEEIDLRAWADHFEAGLVTWVVDPDRSLRVEVPASGKSPSFAVLARGRVEVERAVRRLREALCDGRLELAHELGAEIVEDLFANHGATSGRVLLLLHGPLEGLPVEWLIEAELLNVDWTPVVLPGLPTARPGPARDASSWSLLGAPHADGKALLPAAEVELRELKTLRPDALTQHGDAFNRAAFFAALQADSGLHIATHLIEVDNGLRKESRLLLSNGASLGPAEIRAAHPKLALCVLATCESGGGRFVDAEGAQGIAQAFLESGTRNLVVTSWPVSDEASRVFSYALHDALLAGFPPSRAAAIARTKLRTSDFPTADWAAFRALGRD